MTPKVKLGRHHWYQTVHGLRERSNGSREAACIWAGIRSAEAWIVQDIIFLDDLPGTKAHRRWHHTPRPALDVLFELLRQNGHQIIADVHTHPDSWTGMSATDRAHPIEFRIGLIAIILPHFARMPVTIAQSGVHEYLGNQQWRQLSPKAIQQRFLELGGGESA